MTEPLYRIKPLKWEQESDGNWVARTPLVKYWAGDIAGIAWSYTLAGCRSGYSPCDTIEEAKAAAEAHWRETCEQIMDRVEDKP